MRGKGHDYSQLLIWSALAVTVTRYAGAFIASDVTAIPTWLSILLSVFMGVSGLGMGILDVLGLAYVFDGWRRVLPRAGQTWPFRFWVLTAFVLALFVVGVGILVPFTVSRVVGGRMAETLGPVGVWLWSLAVNLAPYLLIGGIVTGQSGFVTIRADATNPAHDATHADASPKPKRYPCAHCGELCDSPAALASHVRWKHANGRVKKSVSVEMTEERSE